jgi:hypothetical protein
VSHEDALDEVLNRQGHEQTVFHDEPEVLTGLGIPMDPIDSLRRFSEGVGLNQPGGRALNGGGVEPISKTSVHKEES